MSWEIYILFAKVWTRRLLGDSYKSMRSERSFKTCMFYFPFVFLKVGFLKYHGCFFQYNQDELEKGLSKSPKSQKSQQKYHKSNLFLVCFSHNYHCMALECQ